MEKLFIYDLETTGLDHYRHAIHQLSAIIKIEGNIVEKLNYKIKPFKNAEIDVVALEISKVTEKEIMQYPPHDEIFTDLIAKLSKYCNKFNKKDKFHLMGFNIIGFDNNFLRFFWNLNNDKYFGSFFWSDSIDVMSEASSFLRHLRPKMENFKLYSVAETLKIPIQEEKLHDALYDVEITDEIFNKINKVRKQVK